ncbi:MAG: hypothetical protein I8H96_00820 [Sphingomonadaceae bacterium]|nr:hypothetical protein [Sphingomonadaceae bacterium]
MLLRSRQRGREKGLVASIGSYGATLQLAGPMDIHVAHLALSSMAGPLGGNALPASHSIN